VSTPTHTTHEEQVLRLIQAQPLVRARDVSRLGVPTVTLTRLVHAGKLERLARGLYGVPGRSGMTEHRSLAEVAARVPRGVICLLSALRFHEIGTQSPHEVWIAMTNRASVPRLDSPALRIVRMSDSALAEGFDEHLVEGVKLRVFGTARTVVDCFKFRNKIGLDVALEALRDGWRQRKFSIDDLWRHAARQRVVNVMRPYVEAIAA
jgi:predicted transcriptional regulator of viral defense system